MTGPIYLPANGRQPQLWKNGGGITTEVAVDPAGASHDAFAWRLSMAEVTLSGPFSHFEGVDRILAIVEGELELAFEDEAAVTLTTVSTPLAFGGEARVVGRPIGERAIDLNLMMRRDHWRGSIERLDVPAGVSIPLTSAVSILLFTGEGKIVWFDETILVGPFDAIRLDDGCDGSIRLHSESTVFVVSLSPIERI